MDSLIGTMVQYAVEKHGGSHGWHVVRVGPEHDPAFGQRAFVRRFTTKRLAVLYVALLGGDRSVAPEWYRRTYAHGVKRMSAHDAARYAAACAAELGLGPTTCHADPATGEPLAVTP